jgi:hypothetical protein
MSETTDDDEALERRNWNRLTAAVAVVVLTVVGIRVVQLVRRFLNSRHGRAAAYTGVSQSGN